MPTEDEGTWGERTQNEEDEQAAFEASAMTLRTPAKKRNTPNTELQAAPRKPAAKPMTEENDEPNTPTRSNTRHTEQQLGGTHEDTEINEMIEVAVEPGPVRSPMKTLWKTAIRVGYPYRIVPYRTFPLRFGTARARYYRARAEPTPCTVWYDLFCELDIAIRFGSINVRFGSQMYGRNHEFKYILNE